jgi:DNA mismatch endonuclease (patch repair protein)
MDPMTPEERSAQMAKVRAKGNKSTEGRVEVALLGAGIEGWEKHRKILNGKPDFYFPNYGLALFVDGCFWHACPVCNRRTPHARADFWGPKIDQNRKRDNRVRRELRRHGYHVMRVWEHDLKRATWLTRLKAMLKRINEREENQWKHHS